jgi:hypothetical protein
MWMLMIAGAVPAFNDTSNPELQDLLTSFRKTVFLPAHLSRSHQDLIYGTKHKKSLEDEPVNVEIAGEQFRLEHIDRVNDLPATISGLYEAVSLMQDKKDWDSLPVLLEGLQNANRKLKDQNKVFEKLVRIAGTAGRQDVILECIRRVSKTGFELKDITVVREIMWWTQYQALSKDWSAKKTSKALGMAEQISDLLENEKHSGGKLQGQLDPRSRPEVIGVLLELAAVQASISGDKQDVEKVNSYAKRLLVTMGKEFSIRDGFSSTEPEKHSANKALRFASPILYGVRKASEVLEPGSEVVQLLNKQIAPLAELAAVDRELVAREFKDQSLGLWCYEKLFPSAV